MPSSNLAQRKTKYGSLSVDEAMEKLRETSKSITLRGELKETEKERVREALELIKSSSVLSGSKKTVTRHSSYQQVLTRVENTSGIVMVALCAMSLGKTAISIMKDKNKLLLSEHIKLEKKTLTSPTLQTFVTEQSKQGILITHIFHNPGI
jgi:hypothetical protein